MNHYGAAFYSVCPELIVRTDFGSNSHPDYKSIATTQCKRMERGLPCLMGGKCIVMRDGNTGKLVTRKTAIE